MSTKSFVIAAAALAATVTASPSRAVVPRDDAAESIPTVHLPLGWNLKIVTNLTLPWSTESPSIEVVFDTGSENFWVFGPNATTNWGCTGLLCMGPCNATVNPFYDWPNSPTAAQPEPFKSFYAYGAYTKYVTGAITVNDTFTFSAAGGAATTVPDVRVAVESFMSSRIGKAADGTCGAAPPSYDLGILGTAPFQRSRDWNTSGPSVRQDLLQRGAISKAVQSMWFDQPPALWTGDFTGAAVFGGIDKSKFAGPLVKLPVLKNDALGASVGYFVAQPNVTVNGVQLTRGELISKVCHLDSGTTTDDLPVVGDEFSRAFNLTKDRFGSMAYPGPCDTIPLDKTFDLTFPALPGQDVDSVTISVPIRHYARPGASPDRDGLCTLRVDTGGCMMGAAFSAAAYFAADDEAGEIALAQGGVSKPGSLPDQASMSLTI